MADIKEIEIIEKHAQLTEQVNYTLELMCEDEDYEDEYYQTLKADLLAIKPAYRESKKLLTREHKALEIMRNKSVDLIRMLCMRNYKEYNEILHKQYHLTEEEYNLVKEVILNDKND